MLYLLQRVCNCFAVHQLRPSDIKVIAAMGDSVTVSIIKAIGSRMVWCW